MICQNCNQNNPSMDHNWDASCINCGNLTWLAVGQIVDATVDRMCQFGVHVNFGDDVEGIIHITEIDDRKLSHPSELLAKGVQIPVKVLHIDQVNRKIGLSYRRVE